MRLGKEEAAQQGSGVSRRQFAAMGVAVAAAAGYTGSAQAALPVQESKVSVATRDGTATVLFFHPAEGQHPGVVLWPDAAGLRGSAATIARNLASAGFAVAMVDPYYRAGAGVGTADRLAQVREEHTTRDSKDLTAWLDRQDQVASAADGYLVKVMGPSMSAFSPKGQGLGNSSAYMVAVPRGKDALSARHHAAIDKAIHATDRLARIEAKHAFAA